MSGGGELINDNASSGDDIPDDFFDDLANAEFIEELVENAQDVERDAFDSGSNQNGSRENSPRMARCLAEIDVLTKDIERRKKKLEKELSQKGLSEQDLRKKLDRDDDDERRSHRNRRGRSRSRSRSRSSKPKSTVRSPPVYRERERDRDRDRDREERGRRYHNKSPQTNHRRHGRRSNSKSPIGKRRSSSTHKNLTFLEELAKKFAEQGKPFHEEDILAQSKSGAFDNSAQMAPMMNPAGDPNMMPMHMPFPPTMNQHMNPIIYPNVGYPTNMYYGMDGRMVGMNSGAPMIQSAHMNRNVNEIAMPGSSAAMNNVQLTSADGAAKHNQKALLEKCARAVKYIRAEENKVPKLKFLFTRTHIDVRNQQNIDLLSATSCRSPLTPSPLNVEFKLNSTKSSPNVALAPRQQLPPHLLQLTKALGINNETLTAKMRSREIVSQLSLDFMLTANANATAKADSGDTTKVPLSSRKEPEVAKVIVSPVQTCSTITQTDAFECVACVARGKRFFLNKHTQVFLAQKSGSTQTDEDDYRSPLIEMLARLSDAQLVAIKDFIAIMMTARPQNTLDICNLRERMMDIYNLSQRDSDAVRVAQRNRLDDPVVINQKRFRSCDSFGDSGSSRDREFDNSPHGRRSNGSASFNQNERYADSEERQIRLMNEERQRVLEQQEIERIRYEEEMRRREEEAHEMEKQRIRLLEEKEFQMRVQREEEEREQMLAQQQQQKDQLFGFGNRQNRDDGPSFQPTFRNANRNARGAFRNDRGNSRGGARGNRGRKF